MLCGPEYGHLTEWEAKAVHTGSKVGSPRGILILEAQQELAKFLRSTIEKILSGLARDGLAEQSDHFNKAMARGVLEAGAGSDSQSPCWNRSFLPPPTFDIKNLLSVINDQINSHGDEIWLLQTDPRYMRKYATNVLAGTFNERTKGFDKYCVLKTIITHSVSMYWTWEWIREEVQKLKALRSEHHSHILQGHDLPTEYSKLLESLELLLTVILRRRKSYVNDMLPQRPGLRDSYQTQYIMPGETGSFQSVRKDNTNFSELFFTDRLDYCLSLIGYGTQSERHCASFEDYSVLFAMLDEHLNECAKSGKREELSRMDDFLYVLISDMAAIYRLLVAIQLHRPHHSFRNTSEKIKQTAEGKAWRYLRATFFNHTSPGKAMSISSRDYWGALDQAENPEHALVWLKAEDHLGLCLQKFMECQQPHGPRASQERLDTEQVEREHLSNFWKAVRERHSSLCCHIGIEPSDIEGDIQVLLADSDPQYIEAMQTKRKNTLAEIVAKELARAKKTDVAAETLLMQWETENRGGIGMTNKKSKKKTRGESSQESSTDDAVSLLEATCEHPPREPQVQVVVNKKTFAVFKGMFPTDDLEARSQCVQWSSFVTAMGAPEVEFIAERGGGGSEFTFEPSNNSRWAGKGSILFHRPHPGSEIDPVMLASWGKRMTKWFGWNENTFVLKK